jgi:hypothetical protein
VVGTVSAGALQARVARAERAARRDRVFALGALALFFATAQAPGGSSPLVVGNARITASGLAVRDTAGRDRLVAGVTSAGTPGWALYDTNGKLREWQFLYEGTLPVLRQFDAQEHRRLEMHVATGKEDGGFELFDAANVVRLALFRDESGNPEAVLYGSDGKSRAYLETDEAAPFLVMRDQGGQTRVAMGAYTSGNIGMDVRDRGGQTVWKKP